MKFSRPPLYWPVDEFVSLLPDMTAAFTVVAEAVRPLSAVPEV